jgi:hydroxyethylthiazole kinase-like uncharacterized protein yjeF
MKYRGDMLELLTNDEMGEADRRTIASGTPGRVLMENAGAAVARAVMARHPPGSKVAVVAGTGNNGGDGLVAARHLSGAGFRVEVFLVGRPENIKGDAAEAARDWGGPIGSAIDLADAAVVVDALFGAGLDRPVAGEALEAIGRINSSGGAVIAVDLPSGLNGTTGAVMGAAVGAGRTITFFRKKPGHVLIPGRIFCGEVEVADIGISSRVLDAIKPLAFENGPGLWGALFPVPQRTGHKYSRGHAVVVSGGLAQTGAARLAAMAALRGGAGLVTLASPRDALAVNAATNLAVMVRPVDAAAELEVLLADRRFNAVAIGPGAGIGLRTREMTLAALNGERAVVLDADALASFADFSGILYAALGKNGNAVLTPHSGEFHRLFDQSLENIPAASVSKLYATRAAASLAGAVVVHKGADTVVAAPNGRAVINTNAPPWLATAGSGDVLAGLIAALLAQGMPAFEAAAAAVWVHGEAANAAGPGLISEDLAPRFAEVYRRLFADAAHR